MSNPHTLTDDVQMGITVKGKQYWVPSIPYPMFTTKGLPFWKRFDEKNWRPECVCGRIFETLEDYNAHVIYMNSVYGKADQ